MRQNSWFRKVPFADGDDDDDNDDDETIWVVQICKYLSFVAFTRHRDLQVAAICRRRRIGGSLTAIESNSVVTLSHNVGIINILAVHHLLPSILPNQEFTIDNI